MSRFAIRAFLAAAKRHLQKSLKEKTHTSFVIGNESADLDSITCALVYGYILSSKLEARKAGRFVIPVANIAASELPLRPELTALLKHADIKPLELITLDDLGDEPLPVEKTDWTLVDHNALQGKLGDLYRSRVTGVIDHHDDEKAVSRGVDVRIIEKSGSCNSLVTNHLRETWQQLSDSAMTVGAAHPQDNVTLVDDFAYTSGWDAQVAKLALGAILIDTINMKAEHKVTDADKKAIRFLEAKIHISHKYGKDYDRDRFFQEIDDAKSDVSALSLEDLLRKDYKQWTEGDLTLGISSVVKPCQYLHKHKAADGETFQCPLVRFAKSRNLNLFAVMPAFNDNGTFERQLLLLALDDKGRAAAERFAENAKAKLELADGKDSPISGDAEVPYQMFWDQHNLEASRKQVAPLLRGSMSS
ncbi:related to exopolyphosphatase [Lecanosticta acicola]|uniref:Related to exopolyphosphatase n=1 Tax=Lecanosticta acicola TaxID=111012 RepID=A0AAI9ECN0_9PEZI|nr:related to exopolyphosphatase [Lecanosticta acicola]